MVSRYRCLICGCIYDPEKGDPAQGVPPGTPFEKLPENYRCPRCFAYVKAGGRKPYKKLDESDDGGSPPRYRGRSPNRIFKE
jgi:rubredoxin